MVMLTASKRRVCQTYRMIRGLIPAQWLEYSALDLNNLIQQCFHCECERMMLHSSQLGKPRSTLIKNWTHLIVKSNTGRVATPVTAV